MYLQADQWRRPPSSCFRPRASQHLPKGVTDFEPFRHCTKWCHGSQASRDPSVSHGLDPHGHIASQPEVDESSDVSSDEACRRPHAHPIRAVTGPSLGDHCYSCVVSISLLHACPTSQSHRLGHHACGRTRFEPQSDRSGTNQLDGRDTVPAQSTHERGEESVAGSVVLIIIVSFTLSPVKTCS